MHSTSNWRYTPHVVTGLFVLLTAVMVWFIWLAFTTYSGVWTTNSYEKGLDFAQINKDSLPAKAYPYNASIHYDGAKFHVAFQEFGAMQLKSIKAYVMQPTHNEKDQVVIFATIYDREMFSDPVKLSKGIWEVRLQLEFTDNEKYYFARKFIVE